MSTQTAPAPPPASSGADTNGVPLRPGLARRAGAEGLAGFALVFATVYVLAQLAARAVGGTVGLDALFGGPVTGASNNPARSFGPALAPGEWAGCWLYVLGPVCGAGFSALAYQLVRGDHPEPIAAGGRI